MTPVRAAAPGCRPLPIPVGADHDVVAVRQRRHAATAQGIATDVEWAPTRLLLAVTAPLMPAVPLPHVTAPTAVPFWAVHDIVAVGQRRHAATAHLESPAVSPTRLLLAETTPLTPAVPLPHVTAPGRRSSRAVHDVVAVRQRRHAANVAMVTADESSTVLPTRLLLAETMPLTPAVPLPHVTAPSCHVPVGAVHDVVAVRQRRHAATAYTDRQVGADEAVAGGDDAADARRAAAPRHCSLATVPVGAVHDVVAVRQRRHAATAIT